MGTETTARTTRVAVLGSGSLGSPLWDMLRSNEIRNATPAGVLTRGTLDSTDWTAVDLLVEVAGADAAREWVPPAIAAGVDVLVSSCGVFADDAFLRACAGGPGQLLVPAGAIGGLDVITAAARAGDIKVRLTTTKRAGALTEGDGRVVSGEIFHGSARQAALQFPRTANVAVTLGLAVGDLDAVDVVVHADPAARRSSHLVEVESQVGCYRIESANDVLPESGGRTSALTLWSIVSTLEQDCATALHVLPSALLGS